MGLVGAVVIVVSAWTWTWAAESYPQSGPPRAERLEFDPETGEWIAIAPPEPGTPSGDLRIASEAFSAKRYDEAYARLKKWFTAYGAEEPLYGEALMLRARTQIARREYEKAHENLQQIIADLPGTELADQALHHEFIIAEVFLSGVKKKWLGLRLLDGEEFAMTILDDLTINHPESELAELAVKTKADYFFRRGDFLLAKDEYGRLLREFPRSRYLRFAMRRTGESALASFGGVDFDDAPLIEAEQRFSDYVAQFPGSAEQEGVALVLQEIRNTRAAKEYEIGRYYDRVRHPNSAAFYYESTLRNWPETVAAAQAQGRLQHMGRLPAAAAPPPDAPGDQQARSAL